MTKLWSVFDHTLIKPILIRVLKSSTAVVKVAMVKQGEERAALWDGGVDGGGNNGNLAYFMHKISLFH